MGALLESGKVGNIGLKHLKVIKEETIRKWDELGFLDGLNGHLKENMAQLYENQATHLINEATSTDSSGSFETVVFPIIRRVFSKLLANDIVSVQAMNLPIGKLFYFVPKIQDRTAGSHYAPFGYPNAATDPNQGYSATAKDLYDRFYENTGLEATDGLYDYSKGQYSAGTLTMTPAYFDPTTGVLTTASTLQQVVSAQTCTSSASGVRSLILMASGFLGSGGGKLIGPNGNEMDSEEFLASLVISAGNDITCCPGTTTAYASGKAIDFRIVTQKYGKGIVSYGSNAQTTFATTGNGGVYDNLCDNTGTMYVELDLSCPACISCSSVDGYVGSSLSGSASATTFTGTYRIYQELEYEANIGEVSFDLESVTVSVTERKLRAQWSPELAQDVSAFHNIDAEAELTALLSEQVAAEIDREILRDLRKGAAWRLRWDWNGWKRFSAGQAPYTQKDWNQTLITAINQISAQIHKATLRGGANWIVVSSEISAIFDDLEYFHVSNASPEQDQYNMGIEKIGTLAGRYQVYRDPYFPAGKILIGHKGTSLLDTGYVYAPYVPMQLTPTMYNPFTFTPIKGILTRYAKKMVNNRFYGAITVDGVRTFNINELR